MFGTNETDLRSCSEGTRVANRGFGCRLLKCSLVIVPYIGDGEYKLHLMYLLKDALS